MTVTDAELSSLAASHDIINLGMLADDCRRQRHANRTTFVRVSQISADTDARIAIHPQAGEHRIVGLPRTSADAVARVRTVVEQSGGIPVSAFSLADLARIADAESLRLPLLLDRI